MDAYVEPHLHWRALGAADISELAGLRGQLEAFDNAVMPATERLLSFDDVDSLATDAVGGWDEYGNLLAYGWNLTDNTSEQPRVYLSGGVHPSQRWKGIGTALLAWQSARAIEWASQQGLSALLWLGCFVQLDQPGLQRNLELQGFVAERYYFDMYRNLTDLPKPKMMAGVDFVGFKPALANRVRELHNRCLQAAAPSAPVAASAWEESLVPDAFRADWSWLAFSGSELVGYALSGLDPAADVDELPVGWTDRLGVHPDYRGRGISVGLMQRSLVSMAAAGCGVAGIGVESNNPTPAQAVDGLLEYQPGDAVVLLSKQAKLAPH